MCIAAAVVAGVGVTGCTSSNPAPPPSPATSVTPVVDDAAYAPVESFSWVDGGQLLELASGGCLANAASIVAQSADEVRVRVYSSGSCDALRRTGVWLDEPLSTRAVVNDVTGLRVDPGTGGRTAADYLTDATITWEPARSRQYARASDGVVVVIGTGPGCAVAARAQPLEFYDFRSFAMSPTPSSDGTIADVGLQVAQPTAISCAVSSGTVTAVVPGFDQTIVVDRRTGRQLERLDATQR